MDLGPKQEFGISYPAIVTGELAKSHEAVGITPVLEVRNILFLDSSDSQGSP